MPVAYINLHVSIVYRRGPKNLLTDALGRYPVDSPESGTFTMRTKTAPLLFASTVDIRNLQRQNAFYKPILNILQDQNDGKVKRHKSTLAVMKNFMSWYFPRHNHIFCRWYSKA